MRGCAGSGAENNGSRAWVSSGISEALVATAIGRVAAIPAVIAYNAFSQRLNRLESRLGRFADGLHATFSRSDEHTSELQSLMRTSYAVFCLKTKKYFIPHSNPTYHKTPNTDYTHPNTPSMNSMEWVTLHSGV